VVVTSNLNRKDSNLFRGIVLKSIEGKPVQKILDSLFSHLPADGYNLTHKYQSLSNQGVFRSLYTSLYGAQPRYRIEYLDSLSQTKATTINAFSSVSDTSRLQLRSEPPDMPGRRERKKLLLESARSFRIDTALNAGFMELNGFGKDMKLRRFFRRSFRKMREQNIEHLVVDLRGNGGGSVTLSNLLTKYLAQKPFKIADSLYAVKRKSTYGGLQQSYFWNRLFLMFFTRKHNDGYYHFRMYEKKFFKPKEAGRFDKEIYLLTGGNTFSAATLFSKALKDQQNVTIIGEETGGGAYGNSAWLIPDITLPNTKLRFRLPLFRLVIDANEVRGRGLQPEVEAKPTVEAIRKGADFKMQKTVELIKQKNAAVKQR
jgi:C-terminal processing protease CtpA/Prc